MLGLNPLRQQLARLLSSNHSRAWSTGVLVHQKCDHICRTVVGQMEQASRAATTLDWLLAHQS